MPEDDELLADEFLSNTDTFDDYSTLLLELKKMPSLD
jgi:hypothetical protein